MPSAESGKISDARTQPSGAAGEFGPIKRESRVVYGNLGPQFRLLERLFVRPPEAPARD
jgi:hypothetical protein